MRHQNRLVLLVENEPYLQQTLVQALNAAFRGSVETLVSSTPEEALNMAKKHQFDMVVSEHNLPSMSGDDLIAKLRQNHPELPAILLSEVNPDLLSTRTLNLADGFLTKPFELTRFFKVIQRVLEQSADQRDSPKELTTSSNRASSKAASNNCNGQPDDQEISEAIKILVVEDDTGLLYIYQKALGKAGHEVFKARNLSEARPLVENGIYDVMICDIQLGRERGTDLIEEYGQEIKAKGTQIIMVSSYGEYRHITDDLGVDFFLEKPISIASLITLINRLTSKTEELVAAN